MFQDYALFPHLTILRNVMFGLTALDRRAREQEARAALARVGLEHLAESYPHEASGGEQQRVALARAIVPRPGILLDGRAVLRPRQPAAGQRARRYAFGAARDRRHRASSSRTIRRRRCA